ncbi:unnamed protein product, partial [Prorocentrum cordatum]
DKRRRQLALPVVEKELPSGQLRLSKLGVTAAAKAPPSKAAAQVSARAEPKAAGPVSAKAKAKTPAGAPDQPKAAAPSAYARAGQGAAEDSRGEAKTDAKLQNDFQNRMHSPKTPAW